MSGVIILGTDWGWHNRQAIILSREPMKYWIIRMATWEYWAGLLNAGWGRAGCRQRWQSWRYRPAHHPGHITVKCLGTTGGWSWPWGGQQRWLGRSAGGHQTGHHWSRPATIHGCPALLELRLAAKLLASLDSYWWMFRDSSYVLRLFLKANNFCTFIKTC